MVPASEMSQYFYCYELLRGIARLSKVSKDDGTTLEIAVRCNAARSYPPFRDSTLEFYSTTDERIVGELTSGNPTLQIKVLH